MNQHLFTGQCESVDKSRVTNTHSAKAKPMPIHASNEPVSRLVTPHSRKKLSHHK